MEVGKTCTPSDPYLALKMCLDTSVFAKGNIGRREYQLMVIYFGCFLYVALPVATHGHFTSHL
jgi:hypothetical protein